MAKHIEANAKLIAAAPDLLEACEAAMRIVDLWHPGTDCDCDEEEAKALSMMRTYFEAAIRKATQ